MESHKNRLREQDGGRINNTRKPRVHRRVKATDKRKCGQEIDHN